MIKKSIAFVTASLIVSVASAKSYSDSYLRSYYMAQDTIVRNWDGIDNQGVGTNVPGATSWIDLCDNSRYRALRSGLSRLIRSNC